VSSFETIPDVPGPGFLGKLGRGRRAFVLSFGIALSVHAALIGAAVWYVGSVALFVPPHVVLPKGVAAEVNGSDGSVALRMTQDPPPVNAPPATEPPVKLKDLLAPPPAEFEPPEASREVSVRAAEGTSDFGPLPEMSASSALPPEHAGRPAPMFDAAETDRNEPPPTTAPPLADVAPAGGTTTSGHGHGNGGGPQGVVDGMPVPSTRNKYPEYPDDAKRRGWTGTVRLELDLDETGRVTAARVIRSCGHEVLDRAALEAARTWVFSPATMGGRPVPITVPVPVNYALETR
jgi:protein TonB